jgi:HPr kinase/phosphorylase
MSARALLSDPALGLHVRLLAGDAGCDRSIAHTRIQKSGLALAGHDHGIVATRIQILGQTEQSYLERLDAEAREASLTGFFALGLSCVFVTGELGPSVEDLVRHAEASGTPLVHATERSSVTISALHALLDERLAPRKRLHGVLIDVFGVGLLLMGPSGVGKSECALDLVMRGHRLVADDVVECDYRPPGMLFGQPAKLLRHHLEVRGLGILNIKDLFGVTAIRERKRIDVVVRLVQADGEHELDRLGLDERFQTILGVDVPELAVPVRPGRDMASILEVAARNELLKNAGHHAARELFGQIESSIHAQTAALHGDTPAPRSVRTYGDTVSALEDRLRAARGQGRLQTAGEHARMNESSAPPPVGPRGPGKDPL